MLASPTIRFEDTSIGILGEQSAAAEAHELLVERFHARGGEVFHPDGPGEVLEANVRALFARAEERLRENPGLHEYSTGGDLYYFGLSHYSLRRLGDDVVDEFKRLAHLSPFTGLHIAVELDVDDIVRWPKIPMWYGLRTAEGHVWDEIKVADMFYPTM